MANVVIHQSLGDLFLETFASLVEVNPAYSVPSSQVGGWAGEVGSHSRAAVDRLSWGRAGPRPQAARPSPL